MKKSDLNSSMLFKMRNGDLCVLLEDNDDAKVFCNENDIQQGYSSNCVTIDDYDEDLSSEGDDYDIVAIKQLDSCVKVIAAVLDDKEPKNWDWVEETKKEEEDCKFNIGNLTLNITIDPNDIKSSVEEFMNQLSKMVKIKPH